MNNIDKLIKNICEAEYEAENSLKEKEIRKVGGSFWRNETIAKQTAIKNAVFDWAATQVDEVEKDKKIAMLEAKCFAYEQIISNSNFSMAVIDESNLKIGGQRDGCKDTF